MRKQKARRVRIFYNQRGMVKNKKWNEQLQQKVIKKRKLIKLKNNKNYGKGLYV